MYQLPYSAVHFKWQVEVSVAARPFSGTGKSILNKGKQINNCDGGFSLQTRGNQFPETPTLPDSWNRNQNPALPVRSSEQ
ncbi:hypothetical protein TYRP_014257 [Tyrophagus putrescentiae]|nr:hypothetical protein TYRP_014257 [Tyrophagus putrescentiae]